MPPRIQHVLFVLAAFVAGVGLGLYGSSFFPASGGASEQLRQERDTLAAGLEDAENQRKKLQSELARIATVDFADYQRLRNEEAQFIKAKEILGKVFLVLFHNLLDNATNEQKQFAESLASGHSTTLETQTAATEPVKAPDVEQPNPVPTPTATPSSEPAKTPARATWTEVENQLATVNGEKAEAFLQAAVIKDIMSEQTGSRPFKDDDARLQAMQGYYSGELVFLDGKKKPSFMEMTLSSETKDGQNNGQFVIRIVDENGRQSRMGEDGLVGGILKPVSESKALLIRVYKTEFMQIYILQNQGLIIGNYYNETKDGKVEHLGRFKLRR